MSALRIQILPCLFTLLVGVAFGTWWSGERARPESFRSPDAEGKVRQTKPVASDFRQGQVLSVKDDTSLEPEPKKTAEVDALREKIVFLTNELAKNHRKDLLAVARSTSPDADSTAPFRFLRYLAAKPYRDYRPYRKYQEGDGTKRGSAKDCEQNPYDVACRGTQTYCLKEVRSPECEGTEAFCETTPLELACQGTSLFCRANATHPSCTGMGGWCLHDLAPTNLACAGSKIYCETYPMLEICRGTPANCKAQGDAGACQPDDT